jgi:hypothetical protein
MNIVGAKFKEHQIFLPDVLLAAKAMYAGMDIIKPLMIKEGIPNIGKVVIGTVHGDLHDIGKNLVGIMLKGAGFEVIDRRSRGRIRCRDYRYVGASNHHHAGNEKGDRSGPGIGTLRPGKDNRGRSAYVEGIRRADRRARLLL